MYPLYVATRLDGADGAAADAKVGAAAGAAAGAAVGAAIGVGVGVAVGVAIDAAVDATDTVLMRHCEFLHDLLPRAAVLWRAT